MLAVGFGRDFGREGGRKARAVVSTEGRSLDAWIRTGDATAAFAGSLQAGEGKTGAPSQDVPLFSFQKTFICCIHTCILHAYICVHVSTLHHLNLSIIQT
jgi:hypothetical protein